MQGFARRYFVLYQSGLLSYSFEPGKPSRDQIELPHAAISTARGQKDIHIDSNNATFHIKCLNTEDFDEWMVSFRQFIAPPADARSLGRRSSVGRGMSRLGQAGKTGAMVEEMGVTLAELDSAIQAWQFETKKRIPSLSKQKEASKESLKFGLFKKAHAPSGPTTPPEQSDSRPSSTLLHFDRVQAALDALKSQQAALAKLLPALPQIDTTNPPTAHGSPLPTTAEEEYRRSPSPVKLNSTIVRRKRASTVASVSDGGSVWYDAEGETEGAQEFVLDTTLPTDYEAGMDSRITTADSRSDDYHGSDASDTDEEQVAHGPSPSKDEMELARPLEIVRRIQLPTGPVGDEGSLFAVLKKNVGKDLTSIAFPVTFNEPLTLLQRAAEEVEYYSLLSEAARAQDPVERFCYIAAFAVSGYAHTKHRSSRKGFNPMLAETFEDPRMKFISEKVCHNPVILAYHAEGDGWEMFATSSGKTKFWGKSLEIIPIGTNHVKIGDDHYQWKKPSSFMRNLMMGTKYLEHTGKMTIENVSTNARCIVEFKENGYWGISNLVSGTVHSSSGAIDAIIEGRWDESLARKLGPSHLHVLWKISTFPKNALDYYGFTSWGITLNEITSDLADKLPPTDSRYRPDVRALEEGKLDLAESEKTRVEELQRERRRQGMNRSPKWFKQVGDEWEYVGGYWEQRAKGWKDIDPLW